jgi:hypothetical protein
MVLRFVFSTRDLNLFLNYRCLHRVLDAVPLLQNVSVEYVPQIGYLVAVPNQDTHLLLPYERAANPSPKPSNAGIHFRQSAADISPLEPGWYI